MNLKSLSDLSVFESKSYIYSIPICEDGEGPRWSFDYQNFKTDPAPDILMLGAYRHPNTGNNLVGGINLHYLSKQQIDKLAMELPNIMKAGNLYGRYQVGRRRLPDIFNSFYRTYNAEYIGGVNQGVLYPKYGLLKSTTKWLKKKIGGMFKSKEQRAKEAEPQFPSDLQNMNNRLDQVVRNLQATPPEETPPESPEMQRARAEFARQQQDRQRGIVDIERQEDIPYVQATQDMQDQQRIATQPQKQEVIQQQADTQRQMLMKNRAVPTTPDEVQAAQQRAPEVTDDVPELTPDASQEEPSVDIEQERLTIAQELEQTPEDTDLLESITYYSPIAGRYITEPAYFIATSDWAKQCNYV
jgi:hypothetical protein